MIRITTFAACLLVTTAPAALAASLEAPVEQTAPDWDTTPPGLTDIDGNGIADNLQAALEAARPNDRFEVVVTFDQPTSAAEAQRAVGRFRVRREFESVDGFSAEMTKAQILGLARTPGVFRIEPVSTVRIRLEAARSSFGVDAAQAGVDGYTGAGVTVCVIDTGVDPTHEQIDDKDPGACWVDLVGNEITPYDDNGHGTHVASILAGAGTGGPDATRFRGVAPDAGLCAAKTISSLGFGENDVIIEGIDWCVAQGADIINMSIGDTTLTDGQDAMSQAVNNVAAEGVIVVTSAGNSGPHPETVGSPACAEDSLAVAAVASTARNGDYLAAFSSRGPCQDIDKPDVAAPGVNVTAASAGTTDGYVTFSGTSMASPFMAGVAALALEARRRQGLELSVDELKALLDLTAVDRGEPGTDLDWGRGLVDAQRLVCEAAGGSDCASTPFPTHARLSASVSGFTPWEYQVQVDDLSVPLAATLDIEGEYGCVIYIFYEICAWIPDLEMALLDPNGNQVDLSTCPADDDCGEQTLFGSGRNGRWETVRVNPTVPGTYTIRVWLADDIINDGVNGGQFALDVTRGPLVTDDLPPPVNNPPVANVDSATTQQDTPIAIDVVANDSDADGDPLSVWEVTSQIQGTAVISGSSTVTFTPTPGFVGTGGFDYTATDGTDVSNTARVTVTVEAPPPPANDPPVANDDSTTTQQDTPVTVHVLANDTDADGDPLGVAAVTSESMGTTVINGDGSVTFTPTSGFAGTGSFDYTATDGTDVSNTAHVTVTVDAAPPPPTPTTVHVGDLDGSIVAKKKNWEAEVTILVHDTTETPVGGVLVSGSWNVKRGDASCTTAGDGTCTVSLGNVRSPSVTFTVTGLSADALSYASADNHDADGDSNGTAITLSSP